MIIKKRNETKLLEFLIKNFYSEYSVENLAKKTNLSIPTVYRIVNYFEKYLLVKKRTNNSLIKINMNNIYVFHYKLLMDAEKMLLLKQRFANKIEWIKSNLVTKYRGGKIKSIIIFGSLASGEYTAESDIDLLVIRDNECPELNLSFLNIEGNIIQRTEDEINSDVVKGDDFALSILWNNIVYYDDGTFYNLLAIETPRTISSLPERERQLEELKTRLLDRLKRKRYDEAAEFLKEYILLQSRIELLKESIIPTTKLDTLKKISKLKKKDIKAEYGLISEKTVKEMVIKYVQ